MKRKIFVCGGHVTPALALIDEFATDKDLEIIFVGRKYAVEYKLINEKGIRFLSLTAGKRSWTTFMKIPVGFIQAFVYSLREKPALVVSFGGYVALPVAIAAWMLRIPVVTHEQTLAPGLANKIIANMARRVCVAFEETIPLFGNKKALFTGLPMRKELFSGVNKVKNPPLLYITGGSQGAKSLNNKILPAITELTKTYQIIHQTGPHSYKNSNRYHTEHYIPVEELSEIMNSATVVIGRSGANTTMELAALGKVGILIPLPWSAGNEQLLQAEWLASHGGALVIPQDTLTPNSLLEAIKTVREKYGWYQQRAMKFSSTVVRDGAKRLAVVVRELL